MDNNAQTIVTIKLPSGQEVEIVNWSDKPVFSSVDLQSGFATEEIDLFQYVSGRDVPGAGNPAGSPAVKRTATDNDTNVQVQGEMSTQEELLVYAIKPEYFMFTTPTINDFSSRSLIANGEDGTTPCGMPVPTAMALAILQQQLTLRLRISEKIYAEAGLGYFNTGFGIYLSGENSTNGATAGLPSQEAVRSYTLPHHIGAQEKYRVMLGNPNGAACDFGVADVSGGDGCSRSLRNDVMITMRVNLDGLYKRPTA